MLCAAGEITLGDSEDGEESVQKQCHGNFLAQALQLLDSRTLL